MNVDFYGGVIILTPHEAGKALRDPHHASVLVQVAFVMCVWGPDDPGRASPYRGEIDVYRSPIRNPEHIIDTRPPVPLMRFVRYNQPNQVGGWEFHDVACWAWGESDSSEVGHLTPELAALYPAIWKAVNQRGDDRPRPAEGAPQ